MRTIIATTVLLATASVLVAQYPPKDEPARRTMLTQDQIQWGAAPPALPQGAQFAVIEGDIKAKGLFTYRLKVPDGYQIKPHPDGSKKVVTMQLYCPADESQRDLGTTLYRASLKGLINVGSYGLEPVKTLPFLPNVGYAFVVLKAYHSLLKMSWHGRPKVHTTSDHPRITLLNTFYVKEGVGF